MMGKVRGIGLECNIECRIDGFEEIWVSSLFWGGYVFSEIVERILNSVFGQGDWKDISSQQFDHNLR